MRSALFSILTLTAPLCMADAETPMPRCADDAAAKVVSLQGKLSFSPTVSGGQWFPAQLDQKLCEGSRLIVEANSRASVLLPNGITLRIKADTVLALNGISPDKPTLLDLAKGFLHFISRTPKQLSITTPLANAGPLGTEFALQADANSSSTWVYEGAVRFANAQGEMLLQPGEAAQAGAGQAPHPRLDLKPLDAVNWALYYPALLPGADAVSDPMLRNAINLTRQGQSDVALAALNQPSPANNADFLKLRAALRLYSGQSELAEQDIQSILANQADDAEALALQSVLRLTQNHKSEALQLAQRAVAANDQSPSAFAALSYVQQAHFDLDQALTAAKRARELAPHDAMNWARQAELELAQGKLSDSRESARNALQRDNQLERTHTMMGFAFLNAMDADEAIEVFQQAIKLDSTSPLARMGLGLAKIRKGHFSQGRQDLEIAAILDPSNSSIRSYLGKAYYEEGRSQLAQTQLDMAKHFDPKDPTPYWYDALKKQTENRPVEALDDLQHSMELNDNRAVYRSQQMLDSDRAARGASLARIYENLGFEQRGTLEAFTAIQNDPGNYSAHRFLADMYANEPGREGAQLSEQLQAKLLQPVNINPVQPHLAVSQRSMLNSSSISNSSFQDYTRVFEGNRPQLIVSGVAGNQGILGDETTLSGIVDKFSYSLGQYHYQSDGYTRPYGQAVGRHNTAQNHDIYDGFLQWAISDRLNTQFEFINRSSNTGNLYQVLDPDQKVFNNGNQLNDSEYRGGANIRLFNDDHLLFSYIRSNKSTSLDFDTINHPGASGIQWRDDLHFFESQYLKSKEKYSFLTGFSGFTNTRHDSLVIEKTHYPDPAFKATGNRGYSYLTFKHPSQITTTAGVAYDSLNDGSLLTNFTGFSPKAGIIYNINEKLKLRLAGFRENSRLILTPQTLEPTQVAGFNQFYDGITSKYYWFYGGALDWIINNNLFSGAELSHREVYNQTSDLKLINQSFIKSYLNWAPSLHWSYSARYNYIEKYTYRENKNLYTHTIPLELRFFGDYGFFSNLTSTFVHQIEEPANRPAISSNFLLVDSSIGIRLPKRLGVISIDFKNIFDRKYAYQDLSTDEQQLFHGVTQYIPQRTILGRVTLNF